MNALVPLAEALESRRLFDVTVLVGDALGAEARSVRFSDIDDTLGTLRVQRGLANVTFGGTGVTGATNSRGVFIVDGQVTSVSQIDFTSSSDRTRLTMTARGGADDAVSAGTITATDVVGSIKAPDTDVTGDITLGGAERIVIGNLGGSTAMIGSGASAGVLQIKTKRVTDSSIVVDGAIDRVDVDSWVSDQEVSMRLAAREIGRLLCDDEFKADLQLSGGGGSGDAPTLGRATVGGEVTAALWQVNGDVGRAQVNRFRNAFVFSVNGRVDRLSTRDSTGGRFGLGSLGRFDVRGDFVQGAISLFDAFDEDRENLDRLNVRGAIDGLRLNSDGNLGSISAAAMINSTVRAGVDFDNPAVDAVADSGILPDPATAGDVFVSQASLRSLRLGKDSPSFANSFLVINHIDQANFGRNVQVQPGGNVFGAFIRYARRIDGTTTEGVKFSARKIPEEGDFLAQTDGLDLGNFTVRVSTQPLP